MPSLAKSYSNTNLLRQTVGPGHEHEMLLGTGGPQRGCGLLHDELL